MKKDEVKDVVTFSVIEKKKECLSRNPQLSYDIVFTLFKVGLYTGDLIFF